MESHPDSALHLLQKHQPNKFNVVADKALFGLLYFQALDKNNLVLAPDSLISFSIEYYEKTKNEERLALSYFYKGKMYLDANNYKEATNFYLKALSVSENSDNYSMLGEIYSDIGTICFAQREYIESRKKYKTALANFMHSNKKSEIQHVLLNIGRTYYGTKDYKTAHLYFSKVALNGADSTLKGDALQEIATNLRCAKQFVVANKYAKLSLKYQCKEQNLAYRNQLLSDIFYNLGRYDSAYHYAKIAIKYPANCHTRRESYRLLANSCNSMGDFSQMAIYMTQYQIYTDSVRKMELQTKASVLESLYNSKKETKDTNQNSFWIVSFLGILILLGSLAAYLIYVRYTAKKHEIKLFKGELTDKQAFIRNSISQKIAETKAIQAQTRKLAIGAERDKIDKQLYTNCLHLDNWDEFTKEMNHVFNQIVDNLQNDCKTITKKEIIYCCLHLLEIPQADKMLLLETTSESLYKLKQRLSKKLKLEKTKDLDTYLKRIIQV